MGQSTPIGTNREANDTLEVISQINQMDDPREAYAYVKRAIADWEARGEDVPVELLKAHQVASIECQQQSQGR